MFLYTVLLSLVPVLLNLVPVLLNLVPVLLNIDLILLNYDLRIDLPHASVTSPLRNPVSVIIRCKPVKSDLVENTALSPDEER